LRMPGKSPPHPQKGRVSEGHPNLTRADRTIEGRRRYRFSPSGLIRLTGGKSVGAGVGFPVLSISFRPASLRPKATPNWVESTRLDGRSLAWVASHNLRGPRNPRSGL
jgi:hypothetical protein